MNDVIGKKSEKSFEMSATKWLNIEMSYVTEFLISLRNDLFLHQFSHISSYLAFSTCLHLQYYSFFFNFFAHPC